MIHGIQSYGNFQSSVEIIIRMSDEEVDGTTMYPRDLKNLELGYMPFAHAEIMSPLARSIILFASAKVESIATASSAALIFDHRRTICKKSEDASGSDSKVAEANVTRLKVTGAASDAEKITVDPLAGSQSLYLARVLRMSP
eukprot:COSAG02_NODE_16177_length_1106_cov_21.029791_2_plen_142_part_00